MALNLGEVAKTIRFINISLGRKGPFLINTGIISHKEGGGIYQKDIYTLAKENETVTLDKFVTFFQCLEDKTEQGSTYIYEGIRMIISSRSEYNAEILWGS